MLLALLAPAFVVVQTSGGEVRVPVRVDPVGGPVVAAAPLTRALHGTLTRGDGWAEITIGGTPFRFFPGARLLVVAGSLEPTVGSATVRRDVLELPYQFVAEILPRVLSERYRFDRRQARLVESGSDPKTVAVSSASIATNSDRLPNGLRKGHVVTIDPGHGGRGSRQSGIPFPVGGAGEGRQSPDRAAGPGRASPAGNQGRDDPPDRYPDQSLPAGGLL